MKSRHFVALTVLAVAGVLLPDSSWSAAGGMRGGGIRAGGFRAPFMVHRNFHGIGHRGGFHQGRRAATGQHFGHGIAHPTRQAGILSAPHVRIPPAATSAANYLSRIRLSHRAYINGWVFPFTTDGEASYIGTPYDPAEAIPVYAPSQAGDPRAPAARPALPRLSNAADENANQDACRSERVTVPASEGEREITVVRC